MSSQVVMGISMPNVSAEAAAEAVPQLDLSLRGTWIDRRLFRWPYTLSRSFRLPSNRLSLILQTVSGALQADDRLVQRICVGSGAAVDIATQGAMPVYRAADGLTARDDVTLEIADGGSIEYRPDLRILFPNASLSQRVCVRLAETATAIVIDGFVTHDPAGSGRIFSDYCSEILVQRPDGLLLAVDRIALTAPAYSLGKRRSFVAHGTLLMAVSQPSARAEALCACIRTSLQPLSGLYAAVSALPNNAGVALRIAAVDGRHLRLALQAGWGAARFHLSGCGMLPR